jgi:GPH family glycoside/pentoside/hexuronide:cation symporter
MSIYTIISTVCVGLASGIFNFGLSHTGYVPPSVVNGVTVAATQTAATQNMITFMFVGLQIITAIIMFILFFFEKVETHIKQEQAEIAERKATTGEV